MKTYTLAPRATQSILRRTLLISGPLILVLFLGISFGVPWIMYREIDLASTLPTIAILLVAGGGSFFFTLRNQGTVYRSIRVALDEDSISREQLRIAPVRINRAEVTEIIASPQGLCVMTADKYRNLLIPYGLVDETGVPGDTEVRAVLNGWTPIQDRPAQNRFKNLLMGLVAAAGMLAIFFVNNLWIVLPLWLAMIGYYVYTFYILRKTTGIDPKYRQRTILSFALIFFATSMRICALALIPILTGA